MQISQQSTSALTSSITLEVKKEDYMGRVKKALNQIGKTIQLKGFRPGMAPASLVQQMYGDPVLADEVNKMLDEEVRKHIESSGLDILAQPIPIDEQRLELNYKNPTDFTFTFEVGHAPAVDLAFVQGNPVFTRYKIRVEDEAIEQELAQMRKRFATYAYPEDVQDNDILSFTIEECDAQGHLKEDGISAVNSLMPDMFKAEWKDKVLGMKKQDSLLLPVFDAIDRSADEVKKQVLSLTEENAAAGEWFKFTLNNITRSVPAELNAEFFAKVYGEDGPSTEEEVRDNIRKDLEAYYEGRTDTLLVNDLYRKLMDNTPLALPDEFLKRWIALSQDKPVSREDIDQDYVGFSQALRWSLIQKKIASEQGISVSREEVDERIRYNLIQQLYGYGLTNIRPEWVENFMAKQRKDEKVVSQAREQVMEDKVLGYVKTLVRLEDQLLSLEEFKALVAANNAAVNPA
jgi:trigger factor